MRVTEYEHLGHSNVQVAETAPQHVKSPAAFVATRIAEALRVGQAPICYVALGETSAEKLAQAIRCLFPNIEVIVFPPWDCLPYDRIPPTRQCMGRRMDALRVWAEPCENPRLLVTSLNAALQRVPPAEVISKSQFSLEVGQRFDRQAFEEFVRLTGYTQEGLADDPGELAIRDDVIDIFPAGADFPMRIILSDEGRVAELRSYDPVTQRTDSLLDKMVFGPASEAVTAADEESDGIRHESMERRLFALHGEMPTLFDNLHGAALMFASGAEDRLEHYWETIEDARNAHRTFGTTEGSLDNRSLYLSPGEWKLLSKDHPVSHLDMSGGGALASFSRQADPRKSLVRFVQDELQTGRKVAIAGRGASFEALVRRMARATRMEPETVESWEGIDKAKLGTLLKLSCALEDGFTDERSNVSLVAVGDSAARSKVAATQLSEPELRIGDVVVHEDHGVGILRDLECITIEGMVRDAARLEYRDGASVLVPVEEFGKLWRYGSEPDAVTLDRLHTDAWETKRAKIAKDIRSTARHLMKVAKERQAATGETFAPPRSAYATFVRRFPYLETPDQSAAIRAVLADLASGRTMNRLICGDVGYGKTEIALRAAAAVALSGGQVVVVAPTTVLARQHFHSFERRFAGADIKVAMLSRLLKPADAKRVKAGLAAGEINVVIATQAILAKDVAFSHLALLIVDEEHRFGLRDKQAMTRLGASLHILTMSATPIPRTLQSAMAGVQDVSLLTTPPSRRRPVRTSSAAFDRAAMRVALMREYRRGGQSFVVVPRIEQIKEVEAILPRLVPELTVTIAHGKMPAADIDEAVVGFADGNGDILLSTNIIENGLDVPRANTMFIWSAESFGLAQLHQLRGRVGRSRVQGIVHLTTQGHDDLPEQTRLRLSTLVENDRLGSGLAISIRDLDQRGAGDVAGEDQAGHRKVIGTGLYQKLLEEAVSALRKESDHSSRRAVVNLGATGAIPVEYVADAAVRLDLYARLLRAASVSQIDDLKEEFEDRFGDLPAEVSYLLRLTKLQIRAGRLGIIKLDAGPQALALTMSAATRPGFLKELLKEAGAVRKDDRVIFEYPTNVCSDRIDFFERMFFKCERAVGKRRCS